MSVIHRRTAVAVSLVLIISIILALFAIVLVERSLPVVLFVQDGAYEETVWPWTRASFMETVRDAGFSCFAVTVDAPALTGPGGLESEIDDLILRYEPKVVIFSPLVSSLMASSSSVAELFDGEPLFVATGTVSDDGRFDIVCTPRSGAGWDDAAAYLAVGDDEPPYSVALLFTQGDEAGEVAKAAFESASEGRNQELFVREKAPDSGSKWAANVQDELARHSALQVMALPMEGFATLFETDGGLSWIVDARYASIVPERALIGVVADDLGATFARILAQVDTGAVDGIGKYPLVRTFYPRRTGSRSLF